MGSEVKAVGKAAESDSMLERYRRAVLLTGPRVSAQRPGVAVDGYWIDATSFFFLAEKMEPSLGRTIDVPSIVNCETHTVTSVISFEVLARLLTTAAGRKIDLEMLSSAEFDMPGRDTLAVTVGGRDYLVDLTGQRVASSSESMQVPASYSPDGVHACFIKGHDLWLQERATGATRPLTTDGAVHRFYGQKSGVSLSILSYRRRPYPLAVWSADSQWLLTRLVDESAVPDVTLMQHAPPGGGRSQLHTFKFPYPDDPVPVVTYVAIHVPTGRVVIFDKFPALDMFAYAPLSQMAWFGGNQAAWVVRFDRYFRTVDLISLDLVRGSARVAVSESVDDGFIALQSRAVGHHNLRTLDRSNEVIWFSERDGWGHLYLYDSVTGQLKNRITQGQWRVRDIVHVDETKRRIFLLASGIDPAADAGQRYFCAVSFDGTGFEVLLNHDGDTYVCVTPPGDLEQDRVHRPAHARPGMSPDSRYGVVRYGSVDRGNTTEIVDLQSRSGFVVSSIKPTAGDPQAQRFAALAADGVTHVHGTLFLPSDFDPGKRYPLVDYIYPGPQITHAPQTYMAVHGAQAIALTALGFVTLMIDTRGMPLGSRAQHHACYGTSPKAQLEDHAAVVMQLCKRHAFLDENRIGMFGYSAGGQATAAALIDYPEIFRVGASVCGAHDWGVSATAVSDKYRGPGAREKYANQTNVARANKLRGKLLLVSGDMDENVHLNQTLAFVAALMRVNADFDLLVVPNEDHYVLEHNNYVLRKVWDYFVRHLLERTPPAGFEIKVEAFEQARADKRYWREAVQR